jgi:hypothetical protein
LIASAGEWHSLCWISFFQTLQFNATVNLKHSIITLLLIVSTFLLVACSSNPATPERGNSYQTSRSQAALELPPDLVDTTEEELKKVASSADATPVLPKVAGVEIVGSGLQRYLRMDADVGDAWEKTVEFVTRKNYPIFAQNKREGTLETDWVADHTLESTTTTSMRKIFGNVLGKPALSNKYTFWLEHLDDSTTAVHVEHRRLAKEVVESSSYDNNDTIVMQEKSGDEFQLVKVLREMASFFSGGGGSAPTQRVQLIQTEPAQIILAEQSESAWELVERAIITSPYTLDGEVPEKSLFKIRAPKKSGFWSKMSTTKKYGVRLEPISGDNVIQRNFLKLQLERIDLLIGTKAGIASRLEGTEYTMDDFSNLFEVNRYYLYIAFSKNTDDKIVASWQRALMEMKVDGTYENILKSFPTGKMTITFDPPTPAG